MSPLLTGSPLVQQWKFFSESMAALVAMLHEYSSFMRVSVAWRGLWGGRGRRGRGEEEEEGGERGGGGRGEGEEEEEGGEGGGRRKGRGEREKTSFS